MSDNPAEISHSYVLIGTVINVWLYGIMTTQVYLYFRNYPKDRTWLKMLVIILFLADTANAFFLLLYIYDALIVHYNDPPYLARANWIFATDPAITGIIASLVQLFFAWRIKVLTSNKWFVGIVTVCALVGGAGGIATSIEVGFMPNFVDFRKFKAVVVIWLAAEAVGDLIITTILVFFLKRHKTGFPSSDQLVDRIIRMTVQTGLTTSICALLDILFFLLYPTGIHLIFNFALSKLYTNTLMSTLNSRKGWHISSSGTTVPSTSTVDANEVTDPPTPLDTVQFRPHISPEVFVEVESHEMRDAPPAPKLVTRPNSGFIRRKSSQIPRTEPVEWHVSHEAELAVERMWSFGASEQPEADRRNVNYV